MDLNQNNFAHLQNYLTNYWLHNPNLLRASANLRLPIYMNNNYILHQNLLFNQNIIQQQVDLNRRSFPHNYNYGLIQQRGAGDGYSNYSRSQSVNDYNKQSSLCNVSLRSLSPPAESLQEAFRILPRPSITSSCNNLTKDSISHYLEIHKHKTLASEKIRSPSKYEDLHYLGVPYESSLEKFQLFNSIEFNFGPPRKVMSFQRPLILSSEEYYAIREDFACNGVIVNEPEDFNRSISSTSPFTFFGESDFPPLERQPSKYFNWNVPSSEVVSLPMQSSNTSIDLIDRENLKKRLKLEKISEDVCIFCKNNGESEVLYKSHTLKDFKGRMLCPRLRLIKCPICGADGDNAHLMQQCPDQKDPFKASTPSSRLKLMKRGKKLR